MSELKISSTPNVQEYDPRHMAWQYQLIWDIRKGFDYSKAAQEILLSGSVGSGKSLPVAHIAVSHCLLYPGSNFAIGRRTLPSLKATVCRKIEEHLQGTGIKYEYNTSSGNFKFENGSRITCVSWADGNYKKMGSYEFSAGAIEEAQENKEPTAADYLLTRIGRLPHVPENFLIYCANPDSPGHWLAKRFGIGSGRPAGTIQRVSPSRSVYYSRTEENKFLPEAYVRGLRENLDPKLAMRLLEGIWTEIDQDRIYTSYQSERNYKPNERYVVNPRFPVRVSFDFNIAKGKPLSSVFGQYIDGKFHFFAECIVEGLSTEQNLEEAAHRGLFEHRAKYIIHGDAAGKSGDTRSNRSDYAIIKSYLERYRRKDGSSIEFEIQVPNANPSVRDRHNKVNAFCLNSNGEIRFFVYQGCKVVDEGMRLTALKDGATYQENDSHFAQHVTTAIGYCICTATVNEGRTGASLIKRTA